MRLTQLKSSPMLLRAGRVVALCASGGMLLQAVGCSTGLLPVLLSFAESTALSALFGGIAGP